jgi:hypothetical protein
MNLNNVMTNKTKGINIPYDGKVSLVNIPSNEDWAMVVEVTAVLEGLITCKKIWDSKNKPFYARLRYAGKAGTPPDSSVEVGQNIVIYRVGDFNSQGNEDFELHEENPNNYSFVHFVNDISLKYIRDLGNNTGEEVAFDDTGTVFVPNGSEVLSMQTADPLQFFHNDMPPFSEGRIYAGQRVGNKYIVFLPGHGEIEKIFTVELSTGEVIQLQADGQGNVLDFRKVE